MPYRRNNSPLWWASFTDASGKRVRLSTGTSDRKEAEAIEAKWKLESFQLKTWEQHPEHTFDELMLDFLKETMHRRRTGQARIKAIARHLYLIFRGRVLNDLKTKDIRTYIRRREGEGAAASTINKEVGLLSAGINYACREWGWEIPNPAAGQKVREPEGRVRWIDREQFSQLIGAAQGMRRAPHLADFISLAVHTGCRKGELLGLEWDRVSLGSRLIYLEAKHTKAGKRRTVPLNEDARLAIVGRDRFRAQFCPDSRWVFANRDGARIADVKTGFASACRKIGLEDFRIHDLRHTCAAWLVTSGVPLAEVRDLLGHASITMTERYAHLAPENLRNAVRLLESNASQSGHIELVAAGGR